VEGLLQAYRALSPVVRARYALYLAGGWGWNSGPVRELLTRSPWCDRVRWLGYLSDHELVGVMNGAEAVVYPSFYEGFGLPPLEAMACDRPVITTHGGSLAEVVGDAAMIVDPRDERQLSRAMTELLRNRELAEEYRRRGREHLHQFSWAETARLTADVYRRVA
jgi:alpha-1,3-rhamnosyl/mannosyltransferase